MKPGKFMGFIMSRPSLRTVSRVLVIEALVALSGPGVHLVQAQVDALKQCFEEQP